MFRTVPLSIIRSFSLYIQQWYMSYRFADSLRASCQQTAVKTPDDGERNCPKYVEFYSKNKFEKLVHLFGFIIRAKLYMNQGEENNCQCLKTIHAATHHRLNQELTFLYIKKLKLNERLYKIHFECASTCHNTEDTVLKLEH